MSVCHDCGCREGEYHELGCDVERCPFCGSQLISCDCRYGHLGYDFDPYHETCGLPVDIYEDGLSIEQEREWLSILEERGRIPYIVYPGMCARCGELWPEMFHAPDEEWQHYVEPAQQRKMLCHSCYDEIKRLIDEAGNGMEEA